MSLRSWISIITLAFLALIIYISRSELAQALELLGTVNLYILVLLIPVQVLVYLAAGEMMFSYLRSKGSTHDIPPLKQATLALELNFVNHVLPSGGVSGLSYMSWRLAQHGVTPARGTAAQIVRYVAGLGAFMTLLLISVAAITIDGSINRITLLLSGTIMTIMIVSLLLLVFLVSNRRRIDRFALWATSAINKFIHFVTFKKTSKVVLPETLVGFFKEMHNEYLTLNRDKRILIKPYLWGLVFTILDVSLFFITFLALGVFVNPAAILIAYGLSTIAALVVVTPGGTGAYEAIMVSFLTGAGIVPGVAIAGILLTRIAVLAGTIGVGYIFYQRAILKHGGRSVRRKH